MDTNFSFDSNLDQPSRPAVVIMIVAFVLVALFVLYTSLKKSDAITEQDIKTAIVQSYDTASLGKGLSTKDIDAYNAAFGLRATSTDEESVLLTATTTATSSSQ